MKQSIHFIATETTYGSSGGGRNLHLIRHRHRGAEGERCRREGLERRWREDRGAERGRLWVWGISPTGGGERAMPPSQKIFFDFLSQNATFGASGRYILQFICLF